MLKNDTSRIVRYQIVRYLNSLSFLDLHFWFQIKTLFIKFVANGMIEHTYTCSKSTIETLEKFVKYIQI